MTGGGVVPKTRTESEPISEVTKITQPVAQKNVADEQINPATQEAYSGESTRDIAIPTDSTDYWLPETGSIDLSDFRYSTWFIKKATNKPAAVELHISLDGGTTFAKAEGYEIPAADFVLDTWNTIDCPLMLAHAKLKVTTGATGAGALSMAVIRKA
ncbi:hypothetical protein ES705_28964 [subsurface metagenome]